MKKTLSPLVLFLCLLLPRFVSAQGSDAEKKYTAFDMRHNGKIYVVVTVVMIILVGLILYLVRLDGKITKLEKENKL
jgi:hypothetical protein